MLLFSSSSSRHQNPIVSSNCLHHIIRQQQRLFLLSAALLLLFSLSLMSNSAVQAQHDGKHPYAQGNLFVVFQPKSGRSSENNPQMHNLSSIWCQASKDGKTPLPIEQAQFVRLLPRPEKVHEASRIVGNRAFLDFGLVSIDSIGKYRCEISIPQHDGHVTGNLFVYMRPVLVPSDSQRLEQAEKGNFFAWIGPAQKALVGDDAVLHCPVAGYPLPQIRWYKQGAPINTSALLPSTASTSPNGVDRRKYLLTSQSLYIRAVDDGDEADYRCEATNSFSMEVDTSERQFSVSMEQHLRVTTSLSWLWPLIVIVVCLVLLVLIIWGCSKWKKYRYKKEYNVAKKEKELGQKGVAANDDDGQQQRLHQQEPDDVEE